jgi:hypothetical protein
VGWKLFALLNLLFMCWLITSPAATPHSLQEMVVQVLVTIGLVLMAFKINVLPRRFWRGFACAYVAYSFGVLAANVCVILYQHDQVDGEAVLGYALWNFAVGCGLWQNGSSPDQQGNAQLVG